MKKHEKHVKLAKPLGGIYGANEISILGAPCGEIKKLSAEIIQSLSSSIGCSFLDADHSENENQDGSWSALDSGAESNITNKISFSRTDSLVPDFFQYHSDASLNLVNGNHFKGAAQIIYIHPKKSLEKKLDKLTNVVLVILDDSVTSLPAFLENHINSKTVLILKRSQTKEIINFVTKWVNERKPVLNGLVLTGGNSTRMEQDKALLNYHGLPQQEHVYNLLSKYCSDVYISTRDKEQSLRSGEMPVLEDSFQGLGPYGGILSAFRHNPNAAWLVVACDLPFLNESSIENLISKRNINKSATCFIDSDNKFPEPLVTIWEPKSYGILLQFLSKGYSCPRKVLINSNTEIIVNREEEALTNINYKHEYENIRQQHSKNK